MDKFFYGDTGEDVHNFYFIMFPVNIPYIRLLSKPKNQVEKILSAYGSKAQPSHFLI
jgi:hypothetical protein